MNFEKLGFALCKIVSKAKKTKDVNVYFATHDEKAKIKYPVESIELDDTEEMQHMPYTMKDKGNTRQILYISGASGSGKSYYASSYIYFLETSFGLGKKQIDQIKELESRWITICRTIPVSVIHENGVFILNKKKKI